MDEVVRLHRMPPRPPDCDKALALLLEAQRLLEDLVGRGEVEEGSTPDAMRWYLDDAIGMLITGYNGEDQRAPDA